MKLGSGRNLFKGGLWDLTQKIVEKHTISWTYAHSIADCGFQIAEFGRCWN
jgi:hypothetical protein